MERAPCEVVLLTPPGRGAVATMLVTGERVVEHVERCFRAASGRPLSELPLGRIALGSWLASTQYSVRSTQYTDSAGEEVVVCRIANDQIEIHCHGGRAASRAIIDALVAGGCREVDWRDYLRSTCADPIAAQARIALAGATTSKTAAILLDQVHGALRREIEAIVALCETADAQQALERLHRLHARGQVGLHLTTPFRVVLAGRPNVGKSSLMNALLGYTRAIVFDEPGTTRDIVTAATTIDGWPVELSDTAGLRAASDEIEAEGVARARRAARNADLLVLVFDATQPWTADDQALVDEYPQSLVVINKCDLRGLGLSTSPSIATSALHGEGIADLLRKIAERLVPTPPRPGEAIPFTQEQLDGIDSTMDPTAEGDSRAAISHLCGLLT